jgi:4-hydroxybenzoate polyprenyltransferase
MKILNFILFFLTTSSAYLSNPLKNKETLFMTKNNLVIKKRDSILNLIRYKNIIPTLFIGLTGGVLLNPKKIITPVFLVSLIDTILIMSSSMILNDIYDINIDKINHYNRPLVNKEISIKEAISYSILLLGITEFLSIKFLPIYLQNIIHYTIFIINIYTPILKKIPFIKNFTCAILVSFSLFFSGLSIQPIIINKNYYLYLTTISLLFFGSLYNELLLDMRDIEGDKYNKVYTIPVLLGNNRSWNIANILLNFNIFINVISLIYLLNINYGFMLLLLFIPLKLNLYNIKYFNYSKNVIIDSIQNSTIPFYFILIYMILLGIF